MTTTQTHSTTKDKRSAKKKQSFPGVNIGTPKVAPRKCNHYQRDHELLSDWNHAS